MSEPIKEKPTEEKGGFFQNLKKGLSKTRNSLVGGIDNLVHGKATLGPELVDEIEEALLVADVGVKTTQFIVDELKRQIADARIRDREGMLD
jgi:fused signal recognition particle receptor